MIRTHFFVSGLLAFGVISACGSVSYRYVPEKEQRYSRQVSGKTFATNINPTYSDLYERGKIRCYFLFSESQLRAPELDTLEISLYPLSGGVVSGERLPVLKADLTVSFWDGKQKVEIKKQNFTGSLSSLLPAEFENFRYREMHTVTYAIDLEYEARDWPDSLLQKITLGFKNIPAVFETRLNKKKFEKSFISGRPFG